MAAGIFSFLFAFAYAFLINWKIALALVLLSPLPVIFSNFLMPALQKWTLKAKDGEGKVRGYLQEQLATLVTIKCFSCYENRRRTSVSCSVTKRKTAEIGEDSGCYECG